MKKSPFSTLPLITAAITAFRTTHNRYPQAPDFTHANNLPTARHLQRKFGGLQAVRKYMGITTDHRKDRHDVNSASNNRNYYAKQELNQLFAGKLLPLPPKHPAAFRIKHSSGEFYVSFACPTSSQSFAGCVRSILRKYATLPPDQTTLLIVNMNVDLPPPPQSLTERLEPNQKVITYKQLVAFIRS